MPFRSRAEDDRSEIPRAPVQPEALTRVAEGETLGTVKTGLGVTSVGPGCFVDVAVAEAVADAVRASPVRVASSDVATTDGLPDGVAVAVVVAPAIGDPCRRQRAGVIVTRDNRRP